MAMPQTREFSQTFWWPPVETQRSLCSAYECSFLHVRHAVQSYVIVLLFPYANNCADALINTTASISRHVVYGELPVRTLWPEAWDALSYSVSYFMLTFK